MPINSHYSYPPGHTVVQLRLIMHVVLTSWIKLPPTFAGFIAYVQRFDVVSGPRPDPVTGMHVLKRSLRADGSRMEDIVPVEQLRCLSSSLSPLWPPL
jgi:hypothetical protein